MNYAALASGSKGNCHAISNGKCTLLIDAGISLKQINLRLTNIGWDPLQVRGVAISHEHSDHVVAIPTLLRNTNWSLIATQKTLEAISFIKKITIPSNRTIILTPGQKTHWNNIQILPFTVPHDAIDPVAFRIELAEFSAAIVTDLGHQTNLVKKHCLDVNLLVLEANHDTRMLLDGPYPKILKARILSKIGHLSNDSMGTLLETIASTRLSNVVLAHLSQHNNNPLLAKFTAGEALTNYPQTNLHIAQQDKAITITLSNTSTQVT